MTYDRLPLGEPPCAPTVPRILPRIFPQTVDGTALCYCGKRRGLHRYGDECCPNPRWSCGNGEDQWWTHRRFVALPQLDAPLYDAGWKPRAEPNPV